MKSLPSIYKVTCHTDHVGPGSTFVAIKGFTHDGNVYIPQALHKGATSIVIQNDTRLDQKIEELISRHNAQLITVPSVRRALAHLSASAYGYPARSMKIIGITGTKGKTTSCYVLYHILRSAGKKVALVGTIKNMIGDDEYEAPLTTPQPDYLHMFFEQCKQQGVEYVVMETAAQAFSLDRLATIQFDAAAFTNFSLEHSEFYATMDDYFAAKCKLFEQVASDGVVVLNADDERVASCSPQTRTIRISMHGAADYVGRVTKSSLQEFRLSVTAPDDSFEVQSRSLLGDFSGYNILTAAALASRYGVTGDQIKQFLESFEGVPGRLDRYELFNGAVAIIDNAHSPSSYEALFKAVRPLSDHIIAVFGAGGDRDAQKRPIMGAVAAKYADHVILTTDNPRSEDPSAIIEQIKQGIAQQEKVLIELDREQAIRGAYQRTRKGSLLILLGKGPVEYQQVKDKKIPFSERAILRSLRS